MCALAFCARRATFGATRYAELECSVRSGDILLYDDPALECGDERECTVRRRAATLTRLLLALPCLLSHVWHESSESPDAFEQYDDAATRQHARLEAHWGEWRHAALIVCVSAPRRNDAKSSEDESSETSAAAAAQSVPHVLVPAWGSVCTAPGARAAHVGQFVFQPLRTFLNALALSGERCCALRHMFIADEGAPSGAALAPQGHLMSARRANVRDRIKAFLSTVYQAARRRPDPQHMSAVARRVVDYPARALDAVPPPPPSSPAGVERDLLLLMRASTAYLVLQTLFSTQVLRVAPRVADARQLVQSNGALHAHLANDYHFSDERSFSFEREPAARSVQK